MAKRCLLIARLFFVLQPFLYQVTAIQPLCSLLQLYSILRLNIQDNSKEKHANDYGDFYLPDIPGLNSLFKAITKYISACPINCNAIIAMPVRGFFIGDLD